MAHVLVVDDSVVDRRLAGGILEKDGQWAVSYAEDGAAALELIEREPPDIIVTDVQMPVMDGLGLVQAVRASHRRIPIIVMTAQGSEDIAVRALREGAASYLPKSRIAHELLDVVDNVFAVSRAGRQEGRLLECLNESHWSYVLDNDTTIVPALVEQVRADLLQLQPGDETAHTRLGIALHESVVNAIEHGDLELSSDLRETDDQAYRALAQQRRNEPPYRDRRVYVSVAINRAEARFVVRDEGPGFDPSQLPDPTDPANLERVFGRGLLLIRTFMDEVRHNETGNEITMIKRAGQAENNGHA